MCVYVCVCAIHTDIQRASEKEVSVCEREKEGGKKKKKGARERERERKKRDDKCMYVDVCVWLCVRVSACVSKQVYYVCT